MSAPIQFATRPGKHRKARHIRAIARIGKRKAKRGSKMKTWSLYQHLRQKKRALILANDIAFRNYMGEIAELLRQMGMPSPHIAEYYGKRQPKLWPYWRKNVAPATVAAHRFRIWQRSPAAVLSGLGTA